MSIGFQYRLGLHSSLSIASYVSDLPLEQLVKENLTGVVCGKLSADFDIGNTNKDENFSKVNLSLST